MDPANPRRIVSVIGGSDCSPDERQTAFDVGRGLAEIGLAVATGGGGGIMAAACEGAKSAGGLTLAFLAGDRQSDANAWADLVIPTGLGEARNTLVVRAGSAVVAIGGEYGTLSELGFALKIGRPVFGIKTWELVRHRQIDQGIRVVGDALEAVAEVERLFRSVKAN